MTSTFGGLNTMVRGLSVNQTALDTVGHNITNAGTDGYSRQLVDAAATPSQTIYGSYGANQLGTGVEVASIARARDVYADRQYWGQNSDTQYQTAKQTSYTAIQATFEENDTSGLGTILTTFQSDLNNLATQASTYATRVVVRDTGKELTNKVTADVSQLQGQITNNNNALQAQVSSVNQLSSSIYALNKQIVSLEANGSTANDLRDSRDSMVDKLSALVNVNVTEKSNGSYTITSNGNTLVDQDGYSQLATKITPDNNYGVEDVSVVLQNTGTTFNATSGTLKGLQDSTTDSKSYIDKLGTMSAYLLTTFNDAHKAGYGLADQTGHNFFGSDTTNYTTLAYSSTTGTWNMDDGTGTGTTKTMNLTDIFNNLTVNSVFDATGGTDLIAAKTQKLPAASGASTGDGTGVGDNATKLAGLLGSTSSTMLGNTTLTSYYAGVVGKLGVDAQAVDRSVTTQTATMTQIQNLRDATAGVNTNEELTNMIKFQQGYTATSRCLTTMDDILDVLINSTGRVGR